MTSVAKRHIWNFWNKKSLFFSEKSVFILKKKWSWCCFKIFWQKVSRFIHQPTPSFSAPLAPLPAMYKDDSPSSSSSSTLCYISQFLLIYFSKQSLFKLHQDVRALQICCSTSSYYCHWAMERPIWVRVLPISRNASIMSSECPLWKRYKMDERKNECL